MVAIFIFVIDSWITHKTQPNFVITPADENQVTQLEAAKKGDQLTATERENAIQQFIDDELIFRDAVDAGVHRDLTIYQMIIRKHKGLLTADIEDPSDTELKEFFLTNQYLFMTPTTWTLDYRIKPNNIPQNNNGKAIQAAFSDPIQHLQSATQEQLATYFGPPIEAAMENAPLNKWLGPISHNNRIFWFRIKNVQLPKEQSFEQSKDYALLKWRTHRMEQRVAEHLVSLRAKYGVDEFKGSNL